MSKKQIIMIMTDTQRKDMLGCYNTELEMNTPNLDALAYSGMRFEKAYCAQPVCGPARSAIFTGTFPHTNGSMANGMFLNQGTKNIGQRLMQSGIKTGYVGKWHLDGGDYFGDGICPEGWDPEYWYDMRNYLEDKSIEDRIKSRSFDVVINEDIQPEFTYANQCTNRAIQFIEEHKNEDFFLVVSYDEPHHPFLAPSEYFELFKNRQHSNNGNITKDLSGHPEHVQLWAESNNATDPSEYQLMGCNAYVDKEIGRVLNHINEINEEACVIYTSDHGASLGAHGLSDKGPAMYDEITNIPFIVKWKGLIEQNALCEDAISHIDIVPTILDMFGAKQAKALEGKSLFSTLKDKQVKTNTHVFMEFTRYEVDHDGFGGFQPIRAVTDGRYKLTVNLLTTDEMYDLKNDPGEMKNLIQSKEHIEIRNKLHDALLDWMNETRDPFRGYYWERRPWREDARKATWDYTKMTRQRATEDDEIAQLDYATGLPITELVRVK